MSDDGLKWRVEISYAGEVDPVTFFSNIGDLERERYWSDEVTKEIADWHYGIDPASRASGYICRWIDERIDDGSPMIGGGDGLRLNWGDDPEWAEYVELDTNTAIWDTLIKAHPWLARHPDDPSPEESVDPGGTELLPFG